MEEHNQPSPEKRHHFEPNDKYFTISVYAIAVIAIGAVIIRAIFSFESLVGGIRSAFNVLMPFVIGALLAFILNPAVRKVMQFLEKICHVRSLKLRKLLAIAITYIIFLGFITVTIFGIVPQVANSIIELINNIPASINYIYDLLDILKEHFPSLDIAGLEKATNDTIPTLLNTLKDFATNLIPAIYTISMYIVNWIVDIVIAIIVSVYMLSDKKQLRNSCKAMVYAFVPQKWVQILVEVLQECNNLFSSFVIGKAIDSLIIGILCFILMNIFRLPYAVLISVIVGITNMIPYFGPFIGAIPCALLILIISPIQCVYFVIFILVLQQFDGNILGPKILGDSTGLASFWVLFSILLFGGLFGFAGMVLGVPVFAMFYSVVNRLVRYGLGKRKLPVETQEYLGRTGPLSRPKE